MNIILTNFKRGKTENLLSILPICPKTGKVLEIPLISKEIKSGKVIFDNHGEKFETNILDGNCKLQWKVDWAMRWFTFDVDFEMYGKDLTESAILSNKICKTLGKIPQMVLLMNYF